MKLVIQRVKKAAVTVESGEKREIGEGLCVLFGASEGDTLDDARKLAEKTAKLRIFSDEEGKLNLSAAELRLSVLVVSQFTLIANTKKGNRPSFIEAAKPPFAVDAYETYLASLVEYPFREIKHGEFGDYMQLEIANDGPVTIIMDTKEWEKQ